MVVVSSKFPSLLVLAVVAAAADPLLHLDGGSRANRLYREMHVYARRGGLAYSWCAGQLVLLLWLVRWTFWSLRGWEMGYKGGKVGLRRLVYTLFVGLAGSRAIWKTPLPTTFCRG